MESFVVERAAALRENIYCQNCGGWIYCPEMNGRTTNDQGDEEECIGDGCLHKDDRGEYFKCPECDCRHYLKG